MATKFIDTDILCPYYLKNTSQLKQHEIICVDDCSDLNKPENKPIARRYDNFKEFQEYMGNYCCNEYGGYKRCDFYKMLSGKNLE